MRKATRFIVLAIALAIALPGALSAAPKGKTVSIKGEIVDLWCFLEDGSRGAKHKECGMTCAKAGNPMGIVDKKGNVYVLMGNEDHQPAKDVLIDKMASTVTVTGTLVKKGGTQVIYVKKVK